MKDMETGPCATPDRTEETVGLRSLGLPVRLRPGAHRPETTTQGGADGGASVLLPAHRAKRKRTDPQCSLEERFWSKVDRSALSPGGCWPWLACRTKRQGYGSVQTGSRLDGTRKPRPAHIVAYELTYGPVPEELELRHLCGCTSCVNPDHLAPGTHAENQADMVVHGTSTAGTRSPNAKLTNGDIILVRLLCALGERQNTVATRVGLPASLASRIVQRKAWGHVGREEEAKSDPETEAILAALLAPGALDSLPRGKDGLVHIAEVLDAEDADLISDVEGGAPIRSVS